ncbi:MAG: hypothetical protein L6243_04370 [Candidatus Altiarchaeales archaeon]|nr:hypothetical protein [Candidatus Altiarchaeota archaeon]MBU4266743.1 hypothetical protein [Candidatus Altiarchaeota archaeon]MBU4406255.1 hypothetical protein [Candidatus Altiarchaeota archaeon]MBU4436672.1 hypothetical protein [Candidatus Altiarchaeota archaeon]MCG2782804.1 hypothetical protein [Candidatus Altiarchaeales archaeon]
MFQFQLLIDRAIKASGASLEGMNDRELLEFIQSREGEKKINKSMVRIEREIDELKKELRNLNQRWIKKRELAKSAETSPVEQKIIRTKMSHIEEQVHVIREKIISEMLEEIHLLKKLLLDTTRTGDIMENGGSLTDWERRTIINALSGA